MEIKIIQLPHGYIDVNGYFCGGKWAITIDGELHYTDISHHATSELYMALGEQERVRLACSPQHNANGRVI